MKVQPIIWTPDCQSSFDMLCSCLANTPFVWLPDPNKPYLLFTDASKYCYSGVLTQASTEESNEALVQLLTGMTLSPTLILKLRTLNLT